MFFNIYTLTAFFLLLFSLMTFTSPPKDQKVKSLLIVSIIWLILYEGLRWEIGTDWGVYYDYFINNDNSSHMEPGFVLLNSIVRGITNSYTAFLLLQTIFFYSVLYRVIKHYSAIPLMSLCIYYCIMLGYLGSNRQLIALFICFISLSFAFKQKIIPFLLFIALAFTFHTSSIIFLFAYLIINKHISNKWLILVCVISIIVGLMGLVNKIPFIEYVVFLDSSSAEKLVHYSNNDITGYSYFGTIKRLFIVVPCLLFLKNNKNGVDGAICRLYIVGAIIYFLFNGSILQLMAGRGAMYYNITEIFIIPLLLKYFVNNVNTRSTIWIAYFFFLLYVMIRDINYYYILDGIDIYRPYKTILSI